MWNCPLLIMVGFSVLPLWKFGSPAFRRRITYKSVLCLDVLSLQDIVWLQRCYARYCCSLILTDFLSLNRQMQHIWTSFPGWIPYGCTVSGKGLHWLTLFHLSRVSQRALELLSMPSTPLSWQMVWSTGAKGWCWTPWESGCLEPGQPSSTRLSSTARFSKLFLYLFVLVRSHLCWSETKATELLTETQIELVWVIIVQCLCFISLLWCCSLFIIVFVGNPQSYTHN